jgi:uncharacterized protein
MNLRLLLAIKLFFFAVLMGCGVLHAALKGYVTDEVNILKPDTVQRMVAISEELNQKTGVQLATYLPKSIGDDAIETFAERTFASAGIGQKGKDNGVLLVLALNERKVRIEVGYGLEGILPDGKAGELIRSVIVPRLKARQGNDAIEAGHFAIAYHIAAQEGVTLTGKPEVRPLKKSSKFNLIWIAGLALLFFLGRGGRGGDLLPWMILGAGLPNSRGGFGSGGGFGGFGGGGSGGGGASGSW